MYDGWSENNWAMQAAFMSVVANCHRDSKQRPYKPDMFNPYAEKTTRTVTGAELDALLNKFKR